MLKVCKDNTIILTKGNTAHICLCPYRDETGEYVELGEGDTIYFTVKSPRGRTYLMKELTSDNCKEEDGEKYVDLTLTPEDTLDLEPYDYLYDVLIVLSNGEAYTFIEREPIYSSDGKYIIKCYYSPTSSRNVKSRAATFRLLKGISLKPREGDINYIIECDEVEAEYALICDGIDSAYTLICGGYYG